ncbi:endonuclease/exonuclease/phosphatase family protein [Aquihabitans sp. McL0605]|uniref:endonuclease/exonuclease/phosphatase family protein n=1 Tax=Aquihabitans sp. McL0605 TaxID=3415671 RepID=UPI003CF49232
MNTTAPTVWYVGLTEACADDVAYIAFHLSPSNMHSHFFRDYAADSQVRTASCMAHGFGNASLEFGADVGGTYSMNLYYSPDLNCIVKQGWGFQWRRCVAHLTADSDANASFDFLLIRAFWDDHPGQIFMTGDMNLSAAQTNAYFPNSWDVDYPGLPWTGTDTERSPGVDEKIDYVWVRKSFFSQPGSAFINCDFAFSDHCYLVGEAHT